MRLYIDLDTLAFITSRTNGSLPSLTFMRGDSLTVDLSFVQGGEAITFDTAPTIRFGIKASGDYDASTFLVYADTFTGPVNGVYTLTPSLNTSELNALLTGDTASVTGGLQVEWTVGSSVTSSLPMDVTLQNDYIKGTEGSPTPATPTYYTATASDLRFAPLEYVAGGVTYRLTVLSGGVVSAVPTT